MICSIDFLGLSTWWFMVVSSEFVSWVVIGAFLKKFTPKNGGFQ